MVKLKCCFLTQSSYPCSGPIIKDGQPPANSSDALTLQIPKTRTPFILIHLEIQSWLENFLLIYS